ncbi:hypothetical protein DPX16_23626 [Anabarilius grahami]|uniref:Uncharacterized protein n=1 Tax=Anabarilius grahami TaxID=495550 RepID=A0A3N0ZB02_ANAGA|nr:hypothetical protein DPX16_23626 [Anabarilius grahami]
MVLEGRPVMMVASPVLSVPSCPVVLTPEPVHNMAATSESVHNMAAIPESTIKMAAMPESSDKRAATPESRPVPSWPPF